MKQLIVIESTSLIVLDMLDMYKKKLGKALMDFKEKTNGKLPDGKTVGRRGNRLSDSTIKQSQEYYGNAIRANINRTAKTTEEVNEANEEMKNSIMAVLYHCTMLDNPEERHQYCSTSWCQYAKHRKEGPKQSHYLDLVFLTLSKSIFDHCC